jgi:hypothetical protein
LKNCIRAFFHCLILIRGIAPLTMGGLAVQSGSPAGLWQAALGLQDALIFPEHP